MRRASSRSSRLTSLSTDTLVPLTQDIELQVISTVERMLLRFLLFPHSFPSGLSTQSATSALPVTQPHVSLMGDVHRASVPALQSTLPRASARDPKCLETRDPPDTPSRTLETRANQISGHRHTHWNQAHVTLSTVASRVFRREKPRDQEKESKYFICAHIFA